MRNTRKSNKIHVLIVDDSLFAQAVIIKHLESDPMIEIAGTATDAFIAQEKIAGLSPDVVITDVEMPGMNGIELIKKVMAEHPVPFVLISASSINVFDALKVGAVDFVKKPDIAVPGSTDSFGDKLIQIVKSASNANIRAALQIQKASVPASTPIIPIIQPEAKERCTIIAMGASTGGTETLAEILRRLPANCPGIVIVQHMPKGFTDLFAQRLNRLSKMEVREAKNNDRVEAGLVLIAPGGTQLTVKRDRGNCYYVRCMGEEKISGHCPSVDNLFTSVSEAAGSNSIGVLLTGMGRDGAQGLLKMKNSGAYTIGQAENGCVVYGMPFEAYKIGAVTDQVEYQHIPTKMIQYLNKKDQL